MRRRPLSLPSHDRDHRRKSGSTPASAAPFRWALAVIGPFLVSGCLVGPLPAGAAGEDAGTLTEPAAPRSKPAPQHRKVPSCTRVWSNALADSTWNCPDPRPPAPDFDGKD